MQTNGTHPGDDRLAKAIANGHPIASTYAQAMELIAQENAAAAKAASGREMESTRRAMALSRACERADRERYHPIGPGRPGRPVFDRVDASMTPSAKARTWARIELCELGDVDGADAGRLATVLRAIADGLEGEMPHYVESDSRRGCCGVTLIQRETEDGTDYECPLCGKEVTE
jgi:hypothetical protein